MDSKSEFYKRIKVEELKNEDKHRKIVTEQILMHKFGGRIPRNNTCNEKNEEER